MLLIKFLRQSILNDYETCAYMAYVNWGDVGGIGVKDTEEVKNKYAETGIIFHEVMEHQGLQMQNGIVVPLSELHNLLEEKINNVDTALFESLEEIEQYRISLHEQLDWAYQNACCEFVKPLAVEYNFQLEGMLSDCLPFLGTIDRITGDMSKKSVVLEDWKTGKVYTKKELENNIQATIYSLAFCAIHGFMPEEFKFYFTKHKKIKTIKITPDFLKKGTERILSNWFKIKNKEFTPNCTNKYFCKNFCNTKQMCPNFKKKSGWNNVGFDNPYDHINKNL